MKIGIIGAGEVAVVLARYALDAGHEVVLSNSGNAEKLARIVAGLGAGASAASAQEAAQAAVVLLAVPWTQTREVLAALPDWSGRILIDATNPFLQIVPEWIFDDLGEESSSELVARLAPGARVVKAFNSELMQRLAQGPTVGSARRVLLVSGDHAEANRTVVQLIGEFGFASIELGGLKTAGRLQQANGPLAGHDLMTNT